MLLALNRDARWTVLVSSSVSAFVALQWHAGVSFGRVGGYRAGEKASLALGAYNESRQ